MKRQLTEKVAFHGEFQLTRNWCFQCGAGMPQVGPYSPMQL